MFSFTEEFLAKKNVETNVMKPLVIDHLSNLLKQFQKYFLPELNDIKLDWIQNPFAMRQQSTEHLFPKSQEEPADLSFESKLRLEFSNKSFTFFSLPLGHISIII